MHATHSVIIIITTNNGVTELGRCRDRETKRQKEKHKMNTHIKATRMK